MKKSNEIPIGVLYIALHNQLVKNVGADKIIKRKKFFEIIGKHYLVPKCLRDFVIIEMEKRNLVKKESRNSIKVLSCEFDLERDSSKFYEGIGLFDTT